MNRRQIRYFIQIVRSGSFSAAATKLHVAQPALSQHVQSLEAIIGVKLLHRSFRGVMPTEAGLRLLERAKVIESLFDNLADHVRGDQVLPEGEVHFGMPGTISEQLGVPLLEAARATYPSIRIKIAEGMSGFVLEWLRNGTLDLALLYNVASTKHLYLHHALTEEIRLFGSRTMKPAPRGKKITLSRALDLPLVISGSGHGLRDLIDSAAMSIGKKVTPKVEIESYQQIKLLVASNFGFGMLPTMAIDSEVQAGRMHSWSIHSPELFRRIYLGYPSGRFLSAASRAVAQLIWDILRELVRKNHWRADWNEEEDFHIYP